MAQEYEIFVGGEQADPFVTEVSREAVDRLARHLRAAGALPVTLDFEAVKKGIKGEGPHHMLGRALTPDEVDYLIGRSPAED